jgi:hypothetical protein
MAALGHYAELYNTCFHDQSPAYINMWKIVIEEDELMEWLLIKPPPQMAALSASK